MKCLHTKLLSLQSQINTKEFFFSAGAEFFQTNLWTHAIIGSEAARAILTMGFKNSGDDQWKSRLENFTHDRGKSWKKTEKSEEWSKNWKKIHWKMRKFSRSFQNWEMKENFQWREWWNWKVCCQTRSLEKCVFSRVCPKCKTSAHCVHFMV